MPGPFLYCIVTDGVRGPIHTWIPPAPTPPDILDAAADPATPVIAFNDAFERQVEERILHPRYNWPIFRSAPSFGCDTITLVLCPTMNSSARRYSRPCRDYPASSPVTITLSGITRHLHCAQPNATTQARRAERPGPQVTLRVTRGR